MISNSDIRRAYAAPESENSRRLKRLLIIYDKALKACATGDYAELEKALDLLQAKLDYAVWPDLGIVLYAQYNSCRKFGREGSFLKAGAILAKLRKAWLSGSPEVAQSVTCKLSVS